MERSKFSALWKTYFPTLKTMRVCEAVFAEYKDAKIKIWSRMWSDPSFQHCGRHYFPTLKTMRACDMTLATSPKACIKSDFYAADKLGTLQTEQQLPIQPWNSFYEVCHMYM